MVIYLDVCCLNRPLVDRIQERIRREAEAVEEIVTRCAKGELQWISSEVVHGEIEVAPDEHRRSRLLELLGTATDSVPYSEAVTERARAIHAMGFGLLDAAHLACAEAGRADVFLSIDDRLVRRARRLADRLRVTAANPAEWLKGIDRG